MLVTLAMAKSYMETVLLDLMKFLIQFLHSLRLLNKWIFVEFRLKKLMFKTFSMQQETIVQLGFI